MLIIIFFKVQLKIEIAMKRFESVYPLGKERQRLPGGSNRFRSVNGM